MALPVGGLALWPAPAEATTVLRVELQDHLDRSDLVVFASVGDKRSFVGDDGVIYTDTTLLVRDVLYGLPPGGVLVVRQMGGGVGDTATFVPGDGRLETGSRVVVFLADREPGTGVVFLTALGQSEYVVVGNTAEDGEALLRDCTGLTFYDPAADAPLGHAESESTTLDALRRDVAAVGGQPRWRRPTVLRPRASPSWSSPCWARRWSRPPRPGLQPDDRPAVRLQLGSLAVAAPAGALVPELGRLHEAPPEHRRGQPRAGFRRVGRAVLFHLQRLLQGQHRGRHVDLEERHDVLRGRLAVDARRRQQHPGRRRAEDEQLLPERRRRHLLQRHRLHVHRWRPVQ